MHHRQRKRRKSWAALSFNFTGITSGVATSKPATAHGPCFFRGHSPPKSTRPLPSKRSIEAHRFYAPGATPSEFVFLKLILCRSKNRHTALRLPAIRRLRIAATISSSVKSGCSAISASKTSACASSGEMLPPLGLAAMLRVSFKRCIHLIAELALTSTLSAASRRDAPASTSRYAYASPVNKVSASIPSKNRIIAARFPHS